MAGMIPSPSNGETGDMASSGTTFATYLEAHEEVVRRRSQDAVNGLISRVEKSPYGGYVVRTLPVATWADPNVQRLLAGRRPDYHDL